jgi:hypothetical protein
MTKEATPKYKGLKKRSPMKKEVTIKCKGLKSKTSDAERGNPKMQGY